MPSMRGDTTFCNLEHLDWVLYNDGLTLGQTKEKEGTMPIVVSDGDTVRMKITGVTGRRRPRQKTLVARRSPAGHWEAIVIGHKVGDTVTLPAGEENVVYGKIVLIRKV
ncbi:MAG: hypothetical protein KBC16_01805 [Candidatus Pacebacteria bacterium]|nr:hypothetical protein [Candidatus Paceibacterota bacterium]